MSTFSPFEYNAFPVRAGTVELCRGRTYGLSSIEPFEGRIIIAPARFMYDVVHGVIPLEGRFEPLSRMTHLLDFERGDLGKSGVTPHGAHYLPLLFDDGYRIPQKVFREGVFPLADVLRSDDQALVVLSCAQGVSRSPSLASALLYSCIKDPVGAPDERLLLDCLGVVGASRPGAMPHMEVWENVERELGIDLGSKERFQTLAALARRNVAVRAGRIALPGMEV